MALDGAFSKSQRNPCLKKKVFCKIGLVIHLDTSGNVIRTRCNHSEQAQSNGSRRLSRWQSSMNPVSAP